MNTKLSLRNQHALPFVTQKTIHGVRGLEKPETRDEKPETYTVSFFNEDSLIIRLVSRMRVSKSVIGRLLSMI